MPYEFIRRDGLILRCQWYLDEQGFIHKGKLFLVKENHTLELESFEQAREEYPHYLRLEILDGVVCPGWVNGGIELEKMIFMNRKIPAQEFDENISGNVHSECVQHDYILTGKYGLLECIRNGWTVLNDQSQLIPLRNTLKELDLLPGQSIDLSLPVFTPEHFHSSDAIKTLREHVLNNIPFFIGTGAPPLWTRFDALEIMRIFRVLTGTETSQYDQTWWKALLHAWDESFTLHNISSFTALRIEPFLFMGIQSPLEFILNTCGERNIMLTLVKSKIFYLNGRYFGPLEKIEKELLYIHDELSPYAKLVIQGIQP